MRAILAASSPMRSRSVIVLTTIMIMRRSPAAGWRRAMMVLHSSSIATSSAFTRWSSSTTFAASWVLPTVSASMARTVCSLTSPPICSTRARMASSSASNCLSVCSVLGTPTPFEEELRKLSDNYDSFMVARSTFARPAASQAPRALSPKSPQLAADGSAIPNHRLTPSSVPSSSTSAPRRAKSPLVTTPGDAG